LPPDKVAVPSDVVPSRNWTAPVAAAGETVAVKVTDCPWDEGFALEASVVELLALLTVWPWIGEVLGA